ncbi:MAG: SUMF1/EgtB/PvdO family nonheme iron enzyme [Deltaproteobacteria bacterium]|nr:SUMF1/EgtB/PvdO family nonheme iron enzyme [Deltaproteobacteria bacterium]
MRSFLLYLLTMVVPLLYICSCSSSETISEQDAYGYDISLSDISTSDIKSDTNFSDTVSDTEADAELKECSTNKDCSLPLKICDLSKNVCVECISKSDCPSDYICENNQCKLIIQECKTDGECEKGKICEDEKCQTGCRSVRDCPEKMLCDLNKPPFGECVQCIGPDDCQENYNCINGQCVFYCTENKDCSGKICNLATHKCVDCLKDGDCPLKTICDSANKCVDGCRSSRDCTPLLCDTGKGENGKCVECLTNENCTDINKVCSDGLCVFRCDGDEDCNGKKCDKTSGICVDCLLKSDCKLGFICVDKKCIPGCDDNRDCPVNQPVCRPDIGEYGTCVRCDGDEDCDTSEKCIQNNCVKVCKDDKDCIMGVCDLLSGKCVECLKDSNCIVNMVCVDKHCTPGCSKDKPCSGNFKCDLSVSPGRCVECFTKNDCLANGECIDNICKYPGKQCGESCQQTTECASGLVCGLFFQQCLPGCNDNSQCPNGDCLNIGYGGVCMTCPPPPCNPPCGQNEECISGKCIKKCFPPCDFGYSCNNGNCEVMPSDCSPPCQKGYFCFEKICQKYDYGTCPAGMLYIAETGNCIDQFEASYKSGDIGKDDGSDTTAIVQSAGGVLPIVNVTYYQAKKMCENSGKRLCKANEFTQACDGFLNYNYPYGNTYEASACNTNSTSSSSAKTGSYIKCISAYGVVDMSGNVWEWTDTTYSSTSNRMVLGGGYGSAPENTTCRSDLNAVNGQALPLTEKRNSLGFRCCK